MALLNLLSNIFKPKTCLSKAQRTSSLPNILSLIILLIHDYLISFIAVVTGVILSFALGSSVRFLEASGARLLHIARVRADTVVERVKVE